jgi:hypothetical protein
MWSFLVLGIIPGTDIQIDFGDWLRVLTATALLVALARSAMRKLHQNSNLPPTISPESY